MQGENGELGDEVTSDNGIENGINGDGTENGGIENGGMENGVNGTGTHQHENGEQVEGLYRVSVLFGVDDGMVCVLRVRLCVAGWREG